MHVWFLPLKLVLTSQIKLFQHSCKEYTDHTYSKNFKIYSSYWKLWWFCFKLVGTFCPPFPTILEQCALQECFESGEGALANTDRDPEKLGSNMAWQPQAGGRYWTLISKDEVCIRWCARARLRAFTLSFSSSFSFSSFSLLPITRTRLHKARPR